MLLCVPWLLTISLEIVSSMVWMGQSLVSSADSSGLMQAAGVRDAAAPELSLPALTPRTMAPLSDFSTSVVFTCLFGEGNTSEWADVPADLRAAPSCGSAC